MYRMNEDKPDLSSFLVVIILARTYFTNHFEMLFCLFNCIGSRRETNHAYFGTVQDAVVSL